jgi:hypothetical protein
MARNFYLTLDTAAAARRGGLRDDAYSRGAREGRLFLAAAGRDASFRDVLDRLDQVVAEGRRELAVRHVPPNEIEAWDTSCRIMFLLIAWRP